MGEVVQAKDEINKGAGPSIIESFTIEGLYGYRDVSFLAEYTATVLIARNGSGKTTLLGALYALLKGQYGRLRNLSFDRMRCKIRGVDEEIIVTKEDLNRLYKAPSSINLTNYANRFDIDPSELFSFICDDYDDLKNTDHQALRSNPIFYSIYKGVGFSRVSATEICEVLKGSLFYDVPSIEHTNQVIRKALNGYEIVYLPTYRRIEIPLNLPDETGQRTRAPRLQVSKSGLLAGDIQFGLADISDRLSKLNTRIVSESNRGYRSISANMIKELLDGSYDKKISSEEEIPNQAELKLFFSRLEEESLKTGNIPNPSSILMNVNGSTESNRFLKYFLSNLNTVIQATRDTERMVEDFVQSCNKYLTGMDLGQHDLFGKDDEYKKYSDSKHLRLNKRNLSVRVVSNLLGRQISLDALSSGEKQMISIFARLFLYQDKKIVMIDEPEISLSLDWQRQILIDILSADTCSQLIAITHSPFVFDNALEPFARSLNMVFHPPITKSSPDESLESDFDNGELL